MTVRARFNPTIGRSVASAFIDGVLHRETSHWNHKLYDFLDSSRDYDSKDATHPSKDKKAAVSRALRSAKKRAKVPGVIEFDNSNVVSNDSVWWNVGTELLRLMINLVGKTNKV